MGIKQGQKKKKTLCFFCFFFKCKTGDPDSLSCRDMFSVRGWKEFSRTPLTRLSLSVLSSSGLNYGCLRVPVSLTSMQGAQLRGTGGSPASPTWCASPGGEAGAGLSPVPTAKHRGERKSMGWGISCSWVMFFNAGLGESFPKGIGLGKGEHTYRSSGIAKSFHFVILNCLKGSCAE